MLTISEMMNKSPLSPDEDKLLFYSAAVISMLGMVSTIIWKAYKLCGGQKKYVVKHGFTEVVPFVVVDPKPKPKDQDVEAAHEITQL